MSKLLNATLAILLLAKTTLACAAGAPDEPDAPFEPGLVAATNAVALVDNWRSAPSDVAKTCNEHDPGGAAARDKRVADWTARHSALIAHVDQSTADFVHAAYLPRPGIDMPQAIRGKLLVDRMRAFFGGRSDAQMTELCAFFFEPTHLLWSETMVTETRDALAFLDGWTKAHPVDPAR